MKVLLRVLGRFLLALLVLCALVFILLYVGTAGTYDVPRTALHDASIPAITLDGVTLHAETFGDTASPTVIIVHGGPGADYRYLLNLQQLSDEYYVVFFDQRGTGLSPRVDSSELTLDSAIEDLDRIVRHYGHDQPVALVGHSWGGVLATAYVARHPQEVDHLVVAEPGALSNEAFAQLQSRFSQSADFSLALKIIRLWFESLHVARPDAYARSDYFVGHMSAEWQFSPSNGYNCPGTTRPEDHFWRAGALAWQAIPRTVRSAHGDQDWSVVTQGLEDYSGDALMLVSECNEWIGLDYQRTYNLDLYPNPELVVIRDAGHDMFWENPHDSIAAVRDFLGR